MVGLTEKITNCTRADCNDKKVSSAISETVQQIGNAFDYSPRLSTCYYMARKKETGSPSLSSQGETTYCLRELPGTARPFELFVTMATRSLVPHTSLRGRMSLIRLIAASIGKLSLKREGGRTFAEKYLLSSGWIPSASPNRYEFSAVFAKCLFRSDVPLNVSVLVINAYLDIVIMLWNLCPGVDI